MFCTQEALAEEVQCCVLTKGTRLIKPCVRGSRQILIQADTHLSLHAATEQRSQTSSIENAGADILAETQMRFSDGSPPPLSAGCDGGWSGRRLCGFARNGSETSTFFSVTVCCCQVQKGKSWLFFVHCQLSAPVWSCWSFSELSLQVTFFAQCFLCSEISAQLAYLDFKANFKTMEVKKTF